MWVGRGDSRVNKWKWKASSGVRGVPQEAVILSFPLSHFQYFQFPYYEHIYFSFQKSTWVSTFFFFWRGFNASSNSKPFSKTCKWGFITFNYNFLSDPFWFPFFFEGFEARPQRHIGSCNKNKRVMRILKINKKWWHKSQRFNWIQ